MPDERGTGPGVRLVLGVGPGGELRAVYDDRLAGLLPAASTVGPCVPRRASAVEPVPAGPFAGCWFADFSPLGADYQYCLWPPLPRRDDVLAAEKEHLERNWVRRGGEQPTT